MCVFLKTKSNFIYYFKWDFVYIILKILTEILLKYTKIFAIKYLEKIKTIEI